MAENSLQPFRFRRLYLDTNVPYGEGWPRISAKLENVLSLAQSIGVAVYLPEAVERELESRWLRGFDEKRNELREHLAPLQKLLNRLPTATPAVGLPERQEVQTSYRDSVKEVKQKWTIKTAPIPELGTGELLDLAINREVAFEEKGKNFQDTVIYLSVLDQLQKETTPTASVFVSADGIFAKRKTDLEKLAAQRGVELRIYTGLDEVDKELVSRKQESERQLIGIERRKALEALQRELPTLQGWVNANRNGLRLREKYPAIDHSIKVTRVISAVPAFGHKPGDRVAISIDVEVQINGTITGRLVSPRSRSEAWYQPPSAMPGMESTVYDIELPPADLWKVLGKDIIEVEAQATFTGDTYTDFCFLAARLKIGVQDALSVAEEVQLKLSPDDVGLKPPIERRSKES